ncbi:uncharacterized protein J4E79_001080 [Alternaria viburni]|uniref:uncharacterized protein n=1 Tax=Alternaria viburni TaxID=566460 RepID=UPI0020C4949C|nr:uncharacterized protein J4E79_001080 [Alternaria viburni]KAI4669037.1 hypothetical protein J4E79_001080 [Alternaria viburni]
MAICRLDEKGTGTPDELRAEAEQVWAATKEELKISEAAKPKAPGAGRKIIVSKDFGTMIPLTPAKDEAIQEVDPPRGGICIPKDVIDETDTPNSVHVTSNYVRVTRIPQKLYVYTLDFWRPDSGIQGGKTYYTKRREIHGAFQAMIKAGVLDFGADVTWASDSKDLWCTVALPACPAVPGITFSTDKFRYRQIDGKEADDFRATVSFSLVLDDIPGKLTTQDLANLSDYIRALNAIVAKSVHETAEADQIHLTQIGANKFYLNGAWTDIKGLRAVRGYFTSIRPGRTSTLLNVNTATSAFLPPGNVSNLLRQSNVLPIKTAGGKNYIEKLLSGSLVRVLYHRQNYTNSNVDYNSHESRTKTFIQFGDSVDIQKFYKLLKPTKGQPRQLDLSDKHGTTVRSYFKNTCLLEIVPNQTTKATLGGMHTSSMLDVALRLPNANATFIEKEGLVRLGIRNQAAQSPLTKLGFEVSTDLITIPGRILDLPRLYYGPEKSQAVASELQAAQLRELTTRNRELSSWNLEHVTFAKPSNIGKLHVLALKDSRRSLHDAQFVRNNMVATLQSHNMPLTAGECALQDGAQLNDKLATWYSDNHVDANDCTLVLLAQKDLLIYSQVRRQADLESGKHTICALGPKLDNAQTRSNLALKVNMKGAGDNHHLDEAVLNTLLGSELRKRTMILGADVTHSGAGTKSGSPSIACVVGSVDRQFMNYPGSMRLQAGGQEKQQIAKEHLVSMVKERVLAYTDNIENKEMPTSMLFYRDGVSESQFNMCKDEEIPAILEGYEQAGGDATKLSLTFVIVGKRHHTRFYATKESQTRKCTVNLGGGEKEYGVINGNLMPGLLVDDVVTNPGNYNFFLQSHCAIKGTARSAHYHVLQDDMNLGSASLPDLTMQLCSAFSRATHSVSYVAPAYMADRLCERGRAYLRIWASNHDQGELFELPQQANGKKAKLTKEQLMNLKHGFALKLARDKTVWGEHYHDDPNDDSKPLRLSPWHPNLDQGMFWM